MAGFRRAVLALAFAGLLATPPAGAVTFGPAPGAPTPLGPFYDEIASPMWTPTATRTCSRPLARVAP